VINLEKKSDEVFVALDAIVQWGDEEIAFVKRTALASPRKRARICAHKSNDDALHEMIIAIAASSYIHPHRHIEKAESFHIIEGEVDVPVFDEDGAVVDVIELGGPGSGRRFYYRLSHSAFHTLLIRSESLVVHEVTNGPFARDRTVLAPFAPPEDQHQAAREYMSRLAGQVAEFLQERKTDAR
jgi:cupin fold WbuC family metalloprotein